ncbi:MAG: MotA/TolQ/ExbB proton channel family protein, partial [Bacteroidales bacterium]
MLLQITQTSVVADTVAAVQEVVEQTANLIQSQAPLVAQTKETIHIFDLAVKGGWLMIPLLLLFLITVYVFIERYITISRATKEQSNFMNSIRDFVHNGRLDSAKALCHNTQSPIARMIEKGISRIGKPLNDINAAIENVGKLEVAKLEKNI